MDFVPFDALYPPESRYDEIEKILGFVKEGNSCQLIGIPGTGRSNLLGFLAYNKTIREKHLGSAAKNFHFVMINFAELKKRSLFDVTKIIFLTLVDSLKSEGLEEAYRKTNAIFKENLSYQDELILFQGLKKTIDILANEHHVVIVFLFERFEEYVPMLTSDFFTNLRVLRNRAKYHFSVIFSLNRPLEDLVEPTMLADFYEFIASHTIYLPISDAPGNAFRIAHVEKTTGKTFDQHALTTITSYTGGHGKLTRICMEVMVAHDDNKHITKVPSMDFFLSQKRVLGALYEIWYALSPVEQKSLATDTPCEDITYLSLVGLCHDGKIAIPLFASFAKDHNEVLQTTHPAIVFQPETNTITKGNHIISDTLTVSEFRLLRYLLEHPETIIDKEAIITSVWQDAKTTAGVSDQAVDQLIFRLRKKIEDDPNNPQHIQTVKGRGIKFTP